MHSSIKPYQIHVPDSDLVVLKAKLDASSFPDELAVTSNWDRGPPVSEIRRLANYWKDGFDWRAQELKLNELPHFTTKVAVDGFDEIEVHFLHKTSDKKGAIPLLFCHGWPGNFMEGTRLLPLLTDPENDVSFNVVVPSLPNYGFSEGVGKAGFSIPQYAETLHKLMLKLGYKKYVTQAGDWGYSITRIMGIHYPDHCLAHHFNDLWAKPPSALKHPLLYVQSLFPNAEEKRRLEYLRRFTTAGYGYNLIQSTKHATLGLALADSPVGLLAWIYEKIHDWSDDNGSQWSDDELLTWISIYWFSRAGPDASPRIYYEAQREFVDGTDPRWMSELLAYNPRVKIGWATFPADPQQYPGSWGRTLGPVVLEKRHPDGGHFGAWERPEYVAGDLREMFGKGGGAEDVARVFSD